MPATGDSVCDPRYPLLRRVILLGEAPQKGTADWKSLAGPAQAISADYLAAKSAQLEFYDDEQGRAEGLTQFLDEKSYRPGLGMMRRKKKSG